MCQALLSVKVDQEAAAVAKIEDIPDVSGNKGLSSHFVAHCCCLLFTLLLFDFPLFSRWCLSVFCQDFLSRWMIQDSHFVINTPALMLTDLGKVCTIM